MNVKPEGGLGLQRFAKRGTNPAVEALVSELAQNQPLAYLSHALRVQLDGAPNSVIRGNDYRLLREPSVHDPEGVLSLFVVDAAAERGVKLATALHGVAAHEKPSPAIEMGKGYALYGGSKDLYLFRTDGLETPMSYLLVLAVPRKARANLAAWR